MSYAKTVASAIAFCLVAWIGWNVARGGDLLMRISNPGATGFVLISPWFKSRFVSGHAFRHAVSASYESAFRRWSPARAVELTFPPSASVGCNSIHDRRT